MSYIIGRGRYARETYPEKSTGGSASAFARNYATGPKSSTVISSSGTEIPWNTIDSVSAWDSTKTYKTDDLVSDSGDIYISLIDANTGNDPTSSPLDWSSSTNTPIGVPITPRSTGIVRVTSVIALNNADSPVAIDVQAQVEINGSPAAFPPITLSTSVTGDTGIIPILAELQLTVGVQSVIQILLTASVDSEVSIVALSSTLELQEVTAATG